MDIFGVGGLELLVLLLLGGVLLGPQRIAGLAREIGKITRQIQAVTRDLTKELNREIDLMDREDRRARRAQSVGTQTPAAESDGEQTTSEPPEAYKRFQEDFPEEALPIETEADEATAGPPNGEEVGRQNQPSTTESYQRFHNDFSAAGDLFAEPLDDSQPEEIPEEQEQESAEENPAD